jgi:hypothetical protein
MRFNVSLALTIVAAAHLCSALAGPLPNANLTPGVANPAVTQDNIQDTICVSGWTDTIRPPSSYTTALKKKQIGQYHYKDKKLSSYEEDHLISLQLGGHPRDAHNLWPQQYHIKCGARVKDVLETKLKRMVCHGEMTLLDAQQAIATDWVAAYEQHVNEDGCPDLEPNQ